MATLSVFSVAAADSMVWRQGTNITWADVRDGAGTVAGVAGAPSYSPRIVCGSSSNRFNEIRRAFLSFDLSTLPSNAIIISATISLYGSSGSENTLTGQSVNIYKGTQASATAVCTTSDYNSFQTTPLCDTAIPVSSWNASGYNNFALNAAAIAGLSKATYNKFALLFVNDAANTEPTWSSGGIASVVWLDSSQAGTSQDPKLVIEWTTPEVNKFRPGSLGSLL